MTAESNHLQADHINTRQSPQRYSDGEAAIDPKIAHTRFTTKSFSLREVKNRILAKNNSDVVRQTSSTHFQSADSICSNNKRECFPMTTDPKVVSNDIDTSIDSKGRARPLNRARTSMTRSRSFSLKRFTNKLFSKGVTATNIIIESTNHSTTDLSSSSNTLSTCDIAVATPTDGDGNNAVQCLLASDADSCSDRFNEHFEAVDEPIVVMPLPQQYARIDSADETAPQMRPKSRSWSHNDVKNKSIHSTSVLSSNLLSRITPNDAKRCATVSTRKYTDSSALQKQPFLRRLLLPTRKGGGVNVDNSNATLKPSNSQLSLPIEDDFNEAPGGMRPKSKSFSNTFEAFHSNRNPFARSLPAEVSSSVPSVYDDECIKETVTEKQFSQLVATKHISHSESALGADYRIKHQNNQRKTALSGSCSPLYLPTRIRFSLSDSGTQNDFVALLNHLQYKRRHPQLAVTRNIVKVFFKRVHKKSRHMLTVRDHRYLNHFFFFYRSKHAMMRNISLRLSLNATKVSHYSYTFGSRLSMALCDLKLFVEIFVVFEYDSIVALFLGKVMYKIVPKNARTVHQLNLGNLTEGVSEDASLNKYSSTDSVPNNCACLVSSECADMLNESSDDMSNMSEGEFDSKVSCRCKSHFGKVLLDDVFRLPTEQLFTILFSSMPWYNQLSDIVKTTAQSRLFESISARSKMIYMHIAEVFIVTLTTRMSSDYSASPWITDRTKATISTRTATYTMALNHAMAPKSTTVTEKQVCAEFDRLSDGFVVTKESQNAGIPYADSFLIQCTYCITRIGSVHSRLRIHGGIIYKKSIWGIVKG
ncbi:unnamed protein product [Anisakis simplex]|uniref:AT12437p (inferred by orthology to a D. melanogaster protein) n=1 Tax=Anisakis simplex TaxID=6269 RepID=A0A158PN24_ANISI|nr:unnamed protein product [Anisakis simplex]